jgi:hypothetical protein
MSQIKPEAVAGGAVDNMGTSRRKMDLSGDERSEIKRLAAEISLCAQREQTSRMKSHKIVPTDAVGTSTKIVFLCSGQSCQPLTPGVVEPPMFPTVPYQFTLRAKHQ